jgi:hypothetical protein
MAQHDTMLHRIIASLQYVCCLCDCVFRLFAWGGVVQFGSHGLCPHLPQMYVAGSIQTCFTAAADTYPQICCRYSNCRCCCLWR